MSNRLTVTDLSVDQHEAYSTIKTWLRSGGGARPLLTLGGYAGTGKSTVVSVLARDLGLVAFCAFTGKAASVLGRKLGEQGIPTVQRLARGRGREAAEARERIGDTPYCGTIHGLVYKPCDSCAVDEYEHTYGSKCEKGEAKPQEEAEALSVQTDDSRCFACNPPPPPWRDGPCPECAGAKFTRRESLDRPYSLIVVDEASMVTDDMLADLRGYDIPIFAVGDHGQLPPVGGRGSLMRRPDLRLEKIHRQAEGNPIIRLSAKIRETGEIDRGCVDDEHVRLCTKRDLHAWIRDSFVTDRLTVDPTTPEGILGTILVTCTNKSRVGLNYDVREALGTYGTLPRRGEVVICLRNSAPIYNGMRGVLLCDAEEDDEDEEPKLAASVAFVEDKFTRDVRMCPRQFFKEKTIDAEEARSIGVGFGALGALYDMGYALTCHKCQGSQAPEVGVVLDYLGWMSPEDQIRWKYTAITRAQERLVIFEG